MTAELDEARIVEARLRARLADVVAQCRRATAEADRLRGRAELGGADPAVADAAQRQQARAERLQVEIEDVRTELRRQEGVVVQLEADADDIDGDDIDGDQGRRAR